MRDDVTLSKAASAPARLGYEATRARVETYFDKTATRTWERLTSDAPVSKIRETVRAGRDRMRDLMLSRLPADLTGHRVLDAGCGAGQMTVELARRGAEVVAIDISPSLVDIAELRLPPEYRGQVTFTAGDMLSAKLGQFDHVVAMDSLIYYSADDIGRALAGLDKRTRDTIVFTVAPRTRALMAMWYAGKLFPRNDRSPAMVPHAQPPLAEAAKHHGMRRMVRPVQRITSGFYISQALEVRA
jgi:magnesium-protoporphyrin O-methyltransferase